MPKVSDGQHHPKCPHAACPNGKPVCECCCICDIIQGAMQGERFFWAKMIGAKMLEQR